ncbi:hypothetical protein BA894_01215 [Vibrio natriegens]|nr:hypothetical protein BA894_01215 [Vibrio natriegens]
MGYASISTDMYLPALPSMSQSLQLNGWDVELTISSFLIGLCIGQLFWGPISDNYGRRLPIFAGITLFIVGSIGCYFSTTVPSMIMWRIIQALGASTGPVLSRAMVQDLFTGNDRAKVFSNLITIMTLAPLIGPLLGGQIIQYSTWRTIFVLLVFIGIITLFLIAKFPESFPKEKRDKTHQVKVWKTYLSLLCNPQILLFNLAGCIMYFATFAFVSSSPSIYINDFNVSPQYYGLLFGLNIVGITSVSYINGKLVRKLGSDTLIKIGAYLMGLSGLFLLYISLAGAEINLLTYVTPIFLFMSSGVFIGPNMMAKLLSLAPNSVGANSALSGSLQFGFGVLGSSTISFLPWEPKMTLPLIMGIVAIGVFFVSKLCLKREKLHLF